MKRIFWILMVCICCTFVIGCEHISGETTFYGKVMVNPSVTTLDETTTFSIGENGINSSSMINGKDVVKSVSYYIDGIKVAESSDKANRYAATYRVENISAGTHNVTAKCKSNFKHYTIHEHITECELVIE